MINFEKLSAQINQVNTINPSEIFMALPEKNPKYAYLRNVQAEVLDQWFEKRTQKDNIIKMNTGSGKTTVALLILKSCLTENGGHAAYVVPDNYLVNQVIEEAKDLGIDVTTSEKDVSFLDGSSILVINIQKLFNGLSIFGMRSWGNVTLDYVLIDDVHACVDDVKTQFSIRVDNENAIAKEIFNLYKDDLKAQNEKNFLDICSGDPKSGYLSVPFWRLQETKSELLAILQKYKNDPGIKFNYPLIGDILQFCNCTFTHNSVEIEPYAIPISKIMAFANAQRRIFMSATLCDDSQLTSVFDIDENIEIISPKLAADIGDRMILFPQAYTPQITDQDIKNKLAEYANDYNVVVIVPSKNRANFWNDVTSEIYSAINIVDGVKKIRSQKHGLYVLVNKYDGIDLPNDSCRIIVLNGIPDARTALERLRENYLQGSINGIKEKIQKIEQGMGRGVRSTNDYCGVIIMGAALVQILYSQKAVSFFSVATRKQYEVSSILAQDLKNKSIDEIFSTLDYCIKQDKNWVQISRNALSNLGYEKELKVEKATVVLRKAFDYSMLKGNYVKALELMRNLVNETKDPIYKGFLMLEEAKYCQFVNPTDAQRILAAAQEYNHHIPNPIDGIKTIDDLKKIKAQAQQIADMYADKDVNEYILNMNVAIDSLVFAPSSYRVFEKSLMQLGKLLGWGSSRPDEMYNIGPDVLWYVGNLKYAVIECKNEATSEKISKDNCEQLLSSVSWFKNNFPSDCSCIPIMIHPSVKLDKHASPAEDFRMIDTAMLNRLKENVRKFCIAISVSGVFKNVSALSDTLDTFNLTPNGFFKSYTTDYLYEI